MRGILPGSAAKVVASCLKRQPKALAFSSSQVDHHHDVLHSLHSHHSRRLHALLLLPGQTRRQTARAPRRAQSQYSLQTSSRSASAQPAVVSTQRPRHLRSSPRRCTLPLLHWSHSRWVQEMGSQSLWEAPGRRMSHHSRWQERRHEPGAALGHRRLRRRCYQ